MHAPRRIKESKKRFEVAFEKALEEKEDFKTEFQTLANSLSTEQCGKASRQLGINWYEGTKDKPVDAVYIIGSKDMKVVSERIYGEMDFSKNLEETKVVGKVIRNKHSGPLPTHIRLNWPGSKEYNQHLQTKFYEENPQLKNFQKSVKEKSSQYEDSDNDDFSSSASSQIFLDSSEVY